MDRITFLKYVLRGSSLVAQWLEFQAFNCCGPGSIPGQGTEIPQDAHHPHPKKLSLEKDRGKDTLSLFFITSFKA